MLAENISIPSIPKAWTKNIPKKDKGSLIIKARRESSNMDCK